ncbi:hypothetical protein BJ875DRAFT_26811 [Amylocarpus encephaloides]|uniref:PLD phosphodiesterase domain-containing protein n=1 Tax=Amylocarpus encephaloides TaxID=45428 RepID=A0A9P7YHP4_9HELO|nr:hypothetical protein BJ875DRAFT_26811 [Amylocarpus encephaloides]
MVSPLASPSQHTVDNWIDELQSQDFRNSKDDPNYYALNPQSLVTSSQPIGFSVGTGARLLSRIFSACLSTEHELILVTCFWADSISQRDFASLLLKLSGKGQSRGRKIQVRLCFSSRSIWQKIRHTSSVFGEVYSPESWNSIGLPAPEDIPGLEMIVKSVFIWPFSVMHPKFILMDRQISYMPSCNVSWEDWFEGCIEMRGEVCGKLFEFWKEFWARGCPPLPQFSPEADNQEISSIAGPPAQCLRRALLDTTAFSFPSPIPTILLPSPHHRNPNFRFHTTKIPQAPPTPLNTFILQIVAAARQDIYIQTPNLTSRPVINALHEALERGINVTIITSRVLMIFEQLGTAGTITEFEVWKFKRRYKKLLAKTRNISISDLELQPSTRGKLKIGWYHPKQDSQRYPGYEEEPNKSHFKLTIVDEEIVVLGSGNMDRASWYTSQELGVAFFSRDMAGQIRSYVEEGLEGRVTDSTNDTRY